MGSIELAASATNELDRGGLSFMAHSNAPMFGVGEGGKGFSYRDLACCGVLVLLGSPHVV